MKSLQSIIALGALAMCATFLGVSASSTAASDANNYVAVIGPMGSGKSRFTNRLCGTNFKESASWQSTTLSGQATNHACGIDSSGIPVRIIDTVGFEDNSQESHGYSRSVINTFESMDGHKVCRIIFMQACHSRPTDLQMRGARLIATITGVPTVIVQNDRDAEDKCYMLHPDYERLPHAMQSSISNVGNIPGSSDCRMVKLPDNYRELVLAGDTDELMQRVGKYNDEQCHTIQQRLSEAESMVLEAASAVNKQASVSQSIVWAPKEVKTECKTICLRTE